MGGLQQTICGQVDVPENAEQNNKFFRMALPTIPGYWTSRRNIYEQAIVSRRNHETDFRQKWSEASDHFNKMDIDASKKKTWMSDQSFQDSMDAYKSRTEKDIKALSLKRRRSKLAELIHEENLQFEAELRGYSRDNYSRMEEMRNRADGLKSAREEKRKHMADEKLYEHWKQNNPDIRKVEQSLLQEHVVNSWPDQVEEQRERMESARREKEKYEEEMELERQAAVEAEKQRAEEKLVEEKRLKEVLKEQMMELKKREEETAMLKYEQDSLQRQQWELEQLEDTRRRTEDARKKQEFGRILLRQHKAQLMRRSRQIQQELEQDHKLLEALLEKEEADLILHTARKEKAKADATWMKQVIEDQLRVEKAREAELDMLYQDEAARMWQKREADWEKEKQARERLMQEVLASRQEQISDKMLVIQQREEEILEQREQLVREMEIASQLTRRDQEQQEAAREELKLNLAEQVTARRDREESARQRLQEELREEKAAVDDYEEMLRQETNRMKIHGYTPRQQGRRQAWM
ncbi:trichoplein keratin filament-binding protein-like isoform X2 [Haliotis rubra]|uniref:trichoplein keratin filament-binding protein-like isoform X2 n=1 Tax=Haliotis rubra TaxID=36100 RepID=UPI001EE51D22|nr:trichoplein keratin filament-binding protein-like isoform X2 [Haliotis rubra]